MNITLPLTAQQRAELEKQAAAAGTDVATYVLTAVQQALEADQNGLPDDDKPYEQGPYEQWKSDFKAWIASHPSRNPNLDDSRESIYD